MHEAKALPTPMTSYAALSEHHGSPFDNPQLYKSVVGAIL